VLEGQIAQMLTRGVKLALLTVLECVGSVEGTVGKRAVLHGDSIIGDIGLGGVVPMMIGRCVETLEEGKSKVLCVAEYGYPNGGGPGSDETWIGELVVMCETLSRTQATMFALAACRICNDAKSTWVVDVADYGNPRRSLHITELTTGDEELLPGVYGDLDGDLANITDPFYDRDRGRYVEPMEPLPVLLLHGKDNVTGALANAAKNAGFSVDDVGSGT
jgi:xanthine/CO dehydrogenase XdhC/CoxF family maturation factor